MPGRRKNQPHRTATRGVGRLRLVTDVPPELLPDGPVPDLVGPPARDRRPAVDLRDDGPPLELTAAVADTMIQTMAEAHTPLDAELVLCHTFGPVELGVIGDDGERLMALTLLLSGVVAQAELVATPRALTLLRACAAIGPATTRTAAAAAAERLAVAGVSDRPWAGRIGSPTVLRAWRYGDRTGEQASIGVLFDYHGREHAVMVLIDYEVGGGLKDVLLADGRNARNMRDMLATQLAADPGVIFDDLDLATAAAQLREALACPPCPEGEDQVEDVAIYLHLLRSRTELLCELSGLAMPEYPPVLDPDQAFDGDLVDVRQVGAAADDMLRLKVTLTGIRPPVWRRIEVPAGISLDRLHGVLQAAFDWTGSHLHGFEVGGRGRGAGRALEGGMLRRIHLNSLLSGPGDRLTYRYDYGDDWVHELAVEDCLPADPGVAYPRCTGGRRAAPPEDCGGVSGYARLLAALADPGHPDHEELAGWAPDGFDPERFDRAAVDAELRAGR